MSISISISHLEFLVQYPAKEVQHNEVGVPALPRIPAISQQTGHQDKLLCPGLLGSIYQMKSSLQSKRASQLLQLKLKASAPVSSNLSAAATCTLHFGAIVPVRLYRQRL